MNGVAKRLRPELLPFELALIAAVFWTDEAGYIPLSKTPVLLLVAWGSMWLRGVSWRDAGFCLPPQSASSSASRCGFSSSS